jgi:hypothetical protein
MAPGFMAQGLEQAFQHEVLKMPKKEGNCYGYYGNKFRGKRKKAQMDDQIPTIVPSQMSSKQFRCNWARLIQKIYEVDPSAMSKMPRRNAYHQLY